MHPFRILNRYAIDDKFMNALLVKHGWKIQVTWLEDNCVCQLWIAQTDYNSDFVPLADYLLPKSLAVNHVSP